MGSKKSRTQTLDHIEQTYGVSRKGLIRLMRRVRVAPTLEAFMNTMQRRAGRPAKYDASLTWWLETLWLAMDFMNSKAMKEALPVWLKFHDDSALDPATREKLLQMSPATIDRLLKPYRKRMARFLRSGTRRKRGHIRFFQERVPIKSFEQNINQPGHLELDTVAHCGGSLAGQFIWTLNATDHKTGWCEQRAVWHKRSDLVLEATIDIISSLPFMVYSAHTDCGMEFLNNYFVDYFTRPESNIVYTRSRPYHKNDNARVEQKNYTHVRKVLGYERIDVPELVPMINDLYQNEHSWLMNFFVPQRKLIEKFRVGSKTIKRYDKPKTPYQRLVESNALSEQSKEQLQNLYVQLNPFELSKTIKMKLAKIQTELKLQQSKTELIIEKKAA